MNNKTKINAEEGKQELTITREFDLPVELLFKAHTEPEILEQWMGTKVLKLESRKHGGWAFETSDQKGNVLLRSHGVFHEFIVNEKITRTFEMENTPFDTQLEFMQFEKIAVQTSRLVIHVIYRSVALRDQMLKLPFAQGINMAHKRLEEIVSKLNKSI